MTMKQSGKLLKRRMKKILEFARGAKDIARQEQEQKMNWVRLKYSRKVDDFKIPDEVNEYAEVRIFDENPSVECEKVSGPLVVCRDGEDLQLSDDEWQLLARGLSIVW